jgi:type II secretory pathway pseudopilin PulG
MLRKPNVRLDAKLRRQRGIVLMGLLLVMALGGIALMAAADSWTLQRQRERERQLLFAGDAYREAIRHYYFGAPRGTPRTLPKSLDVLLQDDRFPNPVHHLRRLYPDPISGQAEWGERRFGDFLVGVYSQSDLRPIKQAGFSAVDAGFEGKESYKEWAFDFAQAPGIAGSTATDGRSPATPPAAFLSKPAPGSMK